MSLNERLLIVKKLLEKNNIQNEEYSKIEISLNKRENDEADEIVINDAMEYYMFKTGKINIPHKPTMKKLNDKILINNKYVYCSRQKLVIGKYDNIRYVKSDIPNVPFVFDNKILLLNSTDKEILKKYNLKFQ